MPTDVSVIATYRCQMWCKMCNIWQNLTKPEAEIKPEEMKNLPPFKFTNVTGREPFFNLGLINYIQGLRQLFHDPREKFAIVMDWRTPLLKKCDKSVMLGNARKV